MCTPEFVVWSFWIPTVLFSSVRILRTRGKRNCIHRAGQVQWFEIFAGKPGQKPGQKCRYVIGCQNLVQNWEERHLTPVTFGGELFGCVSLKTSHSRKLDRGFALHPVHLMLYTPDSRRQVRWNHYNSP